MISRLIRNDWIKIGSGYILAPPILTCATNLVLYFNNLALSANELYDLWYSTQCIFTPIGIGFIGIGIKSEHVSKQRNKQTNK